MGELAGTATGYAFVIPYTAFCVFSVLLGDLLLGPKPRGAYHSSKGRVPLNCWTQSKGRYS